MSGWLFGVATSHEKPDLSGQTKAKLI